MVGIQLPMNTNLSHLLCLVQSFLFEAIDFCHKNTKVLSQETFIVTRTFVPIQKFQSMEAKPSFGEHKCLPLIGKFL